MKQISEQEFLQLLYQKEALQKDIAILNSLLMQAETVITANGAAEILNKLNGALEETVELILTYANISDKVERPDNIKSMLFNNLLNLNKGEKNECN